MNPIKTLIGRRKFLAAAAVTSTSTLAYKKLSGVFEPFLKNEAAMASERSGNALTNDVSDKYSHILSPLKIGNVVLKSRLLCSQCTPYFLMGPESFPTEAMRSHYINIARNGAGLIILFLQNVKTKRDNLQGRHACMPYYDLDDYPVQNYLDQMVEGIHCYGTKACAQIQVGFGMPGAAPSGRGEPGAAPSGQGMPGAAAPQSQDSAEDMQKSIEDAVTLAKFYYSRGLDAVQCNVRGNESLTIDICKAIKKAMPDMLTLTEIFVREPSITQHSDDMYYAQGVTLDDAISSAKRQEGAADIAHIRIADSRAAHPTTYNIEKGKPFTIHYAEAIKKSGAKIITAPGGGYQNLDQIEEYLSSGKSDMITMGRPFMADPEYGEKIYAGRGEDVVPCILCNKCHCENNDAGPWYSVCSVNPKLGIPQAVGAIKAPGVSKKVAVIGGGPAGMQAALTAADRGHKVTLFEKDSTLGGMTRYSDYASFKWAIKDFKDYLINRINKAGVEVVVNTAASPDMIKKKGYDTIMVAVGSDPAIPKIPGVDGNNVYNIVEAFSKEKSLGRNVVVIGGGEFGVDAAIYLAKTGHNVTMLTSEKELFPYLRPHYTQTVIDTYNDIKNFSIITEGRATDISTGKVTYVDVKGNEKSIQADNVVVYAGLKPKKDEALKFYGAAKHFFTVGDCGEAGGNIQKCIRSAFFTASQV